MAISDSPDLNNIRGRLGKNLKKYKHYNTVDELKTERVLAKHVTTQNKKFI